MDRQLWDQPGFLEVWVPLLCHDEVIQRAHSDRRVRLDREPGRDSLRWGRWDRIQARAAGRLNWSRAVEPETPRRTMPNSSRRSCWNFESVYRMSLRVIDSSLHPWVTTDALRNSTTLYSTGYAHWWMWQLVWKCLRLTNPIRSSYNGFRKRSRWVSKRLSWVFTSHHHWLSYLSLSQAQISWNSPDGMLFMDGFRVLSAAPLHGR